MTGQPWIGRAMFSGPRTEQMLPLVVQDVHLLGIEKDAALRRRA